MKYMGSKNRIAKFILPIMLENRKEGQWWVEPFVGGANMIDKVGGNRIGADSNKYLIALLRYIQHGNSLPLYSKDIYTKVRLNNEDFEDWQVGWVGIGHSYNGKWFGGYAGEIVTKEGNIRDYRKETIRNIKKSLESLIEVTFIHNDYQKLSIPKNSIIYCDPPYANTTKYKTGTFDHESFWQWCRDKSKEGYTVFISEYNAPDDFEVLWEKEIVSSLTKDTGSKKGIEKLFRYKG